jgi:hypothetical protein
LPGLFTWMSCKLESFFFGWSLVMWSIRHKFYCFSYATQLVGSVSEYSSICYVFILHGMVKAGWSFYHLHCKLKGLIGILMCICHKPSLRTSLEVKFIFINSGQWRTIEHAYQNAIWFQSMDIYANLTCSFVDQCWPGFREDCMKTATKFHLAKQEWSSKFNPQSYWLIHKETNLTCHDISKTCACRSSLYCSLFWPFGKNLT